MSIQILPKIVRDRLVISYDIANRYSYRQEVSNIITEPLDMTAQSWTNSYATYAVTASTGVSDGYFVISETTSLNSHIVRKPFSAIAGNIYTFSCYVKKRGRKFVGLSLSSYANWTGNTGAETYFDLDTGTAYVWDGAPLDYGIQEVSPDEYRIWITAECLNNTTSGHNLWTFEENSYTPGVRFADFVGDPTKGVFTKWHQLEVNGVNPPNPFSPESVGLTPGTNGGVINLVGKSPYSASIVNNLSPGIEYSDNPPALVTNNDTTTEDNYLQISPRIEVPDNGEFTLEFWLKIDASTTYDTHSICGRRSTQPHLMITMNQTDGSDWKVRWRMAGGTTHVDLGTSSITSSNIKDWTQIVVVCNSSRVVELYVNGESKGSSTLATTEFYIQTFLAGYLSSTTKVGLRGEGSIIRYYDKPLSASEVNTNFNALRKRFGL